MNKQKTPATFATRCHVKITNTRVPIFIFSEIFQISTSVGRMFFLPSLGFSYFLSSFSFETAQNATAIVSINDRRGKSFTAAAVN